MLNPTLAKNLSVTADVPLTASERLAALPSQTSLQERESLYALTKSYYAGQGDILDIGCAAGGSSFALALGVQDAGKHGVVQCLDLFDGYSLAAFSDAGRDSEITTDLNLFERVTLDVATHVAAQQMDLIAGFEAFCQGRRVEIAHIDAAKSLPLWSAIFRSLAKTVVPGQTIWVFQDFDRVRLPWQAYGLDALTSVGRVIGGSHYGTLYFKFDTPIPAPLIDQLAGDAFTLESKIAATRRMYDCAISNFPELFEHDWPARDLTTGAIAYCHHYAGDSETARALFEQTSVPFRCRRENVGYSAELGLPLPR
jgi:hypothetical protein